MALATGPCWQLPSSAKVTRSAARSHAHPLRQPGHNVNAYVSYIARLVDAVGVDHVGIGTDMDGIGPGTIFGDYARWPSLASARLDRYGRDDVARLLGANFQRVYARVSVPAPA